MDIAAPHSTKLAAPVRLHYASATPGSYPAVGSERPLPIISTEHLRIHEGVMYSFGHLWDSANKVLDGAFADIVVATPASVTIHGVFVVDSGGESELYVYEGAVVSGGTQLVVGNRNRRSANVSSLVAAHSPSVITLGNQIESSLVVGGSGPHSQGGSANFDDEFILALDTVYLIRLKNTSGLSKAMHINAVFYEVANG